jgi:hypothetical protein
VHSLQWEIKNHCTCLGKAIQVSFETIVQYYATCLDPDPPLVTRFFIAANENNSRVGGTVAMAIENASADWLP